MNAGESKCVDLRLGQLRQGSVRYEIEWPGLSTEEMAEGCVLPCVAYPVSDVELQA